MKPKVAATIIVKASDDSEANSLAHALGSINGYADIFIELNAPKGKKINPKVRSIAEQFTDNVYEYEWNNNFVNARNYLMSKVPKDYDWIMWLDADDEIENPENIQPSLAVMPEDVHGVYIYYDYQKDEHGNVIVGHWNTRAVRNNGAFVWKSSIDDDEVSVHETLIAKRQVKSVANDEWKVVHKAPPEHYKDSLVRNIELLEGMAERQSKKPEGIDPRILFYLGSHYNEAYDFRRAKELFYEYLKLSGWSEERGEAHVYMGRILKMEGNLSGARTAFLTALGENPDNTSAYLELGKLESKEQRYKQASQWLKRGVEVEREITPMVQYNNDFELYTVYAEVLSNLGGKDLPEALEMAERALKLHPYDPQAKENRDNVQKLVDYRDTLQGVSKLLNQVEEGKIIPFLDTLPEDLNDSPIIINARQRYTKPKKWSKKSIAIYVGQGPLGSWGPWSLEGGIGGSEEAVIRLSKELVKLGWDVDIYATPGKEVGVYDKDYKKLSNVELAIPHKGIRNFITWHHYWEINNQDEFDVLVSWRQPAFFDFDWKARKKYLWLHDVVDKEEFFDERLENIDKIIYVSDYHSKRPESEHIANKQKFPSGNGIDPKDFEKHDGKFKRDSHRCIYMSANERGLRILYDIWPDVIKEVPDATLDVYYGWHSFDAINRDNPERMAWKASMQHKAKTLKGVTERGRIGHDDLNKEIFQSGIFAYPCFFPEVSCITAMKAQCGGAIPVTSDFANMKNIIKFGEQVPMNNFKPEDIERYKERLIWWLKHPKEQDKIREEMMSWSRQHFTWAKTAQQWSQEMA